MDKDELLVAQKDTTKLARTLEVLQDHKWHCGKHELPGTQHAALIRQLKQQGWQIEKDLRWCDNCQENVTHRRLC